MKHSYAILTNGIKHSDDCAITQTAAVAHKTNKHSAEFLWIKQQNSTVK